eukprot:CAMPEP_0195306720 /NCGR_PEP_ID=MMETSP0707-20130614/37345_1 /TAXON_ID=33640 /ORGANISM="Asterionellopsis glacialis, Strain CCMP134" /LENGTH=435 /DNA_ID=CAMNT_0040370945 /DNA_START=45 /DNA_END=1348 /DNA_ORIENTATION=-
MEEDEAAADGFPMVVNDEEGDDHFICVHEERFQSCVEVMARTKCNFGATAPAVEIPLARLTMGSGVVQFHVDEQILVDQKVQFLSFRHEETGAQLELQIRPCHGGNGEKVESSSSSSSGSNARSWVDGVRNRINLMDSDDNGSEVEYVDGEGQSVDMNEFEEDGFVVNEDEDGSVEDDDEDYCCLCHDGGELIACDGGDHLDGCGRYFHISCIHRDEVPPGDWICQDCATKAHFSVGVEGHEFESNLEDNNRNDTHSDDDDDDDDCLSDPKKQKRLKSKRRVLNEEDSDNEDFEGVQESKSKKVILDDDDDPDDEKIVNTKGDKNLKHTDEEENNDDDDVVIVHDDDSPEQKKQKRLKSQSRVLHDEDTDDEEFEIVQKRKPKKVVLDDDDSDEEESDDEKMVNTKGDKDLKQTGDEESDRSLDIIPPQRIYKTA